MKTRSGFVSNSSSASFVIYNWFDIPEEKREYVKNYDSNALSVWKEKKIQYKTEEELNGYIQDFPFIGEEYYIDYNDENHFGKYDFGYINDSCRYEIEEDREKNICKLKTFMTNFDMEAWLKYNEINFDITRDIWS